MLDPCLHGSSVKCRSEQPCHVGLDPAWTQGFPPLRSSWVQDHMVFGLQIIHGQVEEDLRAGKRNEKKEIDM
jgi:hypothetical protein